MRGTFKPMNQGQAARDFLVKSLEDGVVPVRDLKKQALLARVAQRTMQREANELGIDKSAAGWALPPGLARAVAQMKAEKARLNGEHAETHLDSDEVARVLQLVPKS